VTALVIGNFATMTLLTKNSFLDEINKQYVVTAKAKGLTAIACSTAMCSATPCCW
jgi:microcin C transport system permease protein